MFQRRSEPGLTQEIDVAGAIRRAITPSAEGVGVPAHPGELLVEYQAIVIFRSLE
jgi:hypothetical protein